MRISSDNLSRNSCIKKVLVGPNASLTISKAMIYTCQAPFVQTMDSVIHWIDHCPADRYLGNQLCLIQWIEIYPVDSVMHLLKWRGKEERNTSHFCQIKGKNITITTS